MTLVPIPDAPRIGEQPASVIVGIGKTEADGSLTITRVWRPTRRKRVRSPRKLALCRLRSRRRTIYGPARPVGPSQLKRSACWVRWPASEAVAARLNRTKPSSNGAYKYSPRYVRPSAEYGRVPLCSSLRRGGQARTGTQSDEWGILAADIAPLGTNA